MTLRAAAAALNVAPATAHRWWHRWPGGERRASRLGRLALRSLLAPAPPATAPQRRRGGADPARPRARPASARGAWPGSAAAPARRSGRCFTATGSRGAGAAPRQSYRRYEWSRPGALLHVDMAQLARFERPGHRGPRAIAEDRRRQARRRRLRLSSLRRRRPHPLRLRRTAPRRAPARPRPRCSSGRSPTSPSSGSARPRR